MDTKTIVMFAAFVTPSPEPDFSACNSPMSQLSFSAFNSPQSATPASPVPNQLAPYGYEWQRWPGENWKLVKVAISEVVVAPFQTMSNTTLRTSAQRAVVPNTKYPGTLVEVGTTTLAPTMVLGGIINCSPVG